MTSFRKYGLCRKNIRASTMTRECYSWVMPSSREKSRYPEPSRARKRAKVRLKAIHGP
jgi:hypothetical protein